MKMIGKHVQTCRVGRCRCSNAKDSRGRRDERRKAKRREKQKLLQALIKEEAA